jgi:hypothetical protein
MRRKIPPETAEQHEELRRRLVRRAWELMDEIDASLHAGGFEASARGAAELREIRAALDRMDGGTGGDAAKQSGGSQ